MLAIPATSTELLGGAAFDDEYFCIVLWMGIFMPLTLKLFDDCAIFLFVFTVENVGG